VLGASGNFFDDHGGQLAVFYLDRRIELPEDMVTFEAGFNLVRTLDDGSPMVVPADTPVVIELADDVGLQQISCGEICFSFEGGGPRPCPAEEPDCPFEVPEIPADATVECAPDGRQYQWDRTACASPCSCTNESQYVELGPEQPIPSGWPCPTSSS
jgi:hypothetical protein